MVRFYSVKRNFTAPFMTILELLNDEYPHPKGFVGWANFVLGCAKDTLAKFDEAIGDAGGCCPECGVIKPAPITRYVVEHLDYVDTKVYCSECRYEIVKAKFLDGSRL